MIRIVLLIVVMNLSLPAGARDLTAADKEAIGARADTFQAAMSDGNIASMVSEMPPRIFAFMAARAGVSEEQLTAGIIFAMQAASQTVTVEYAEIEFAKATYHVTDNGTPYALIPTRVVLWAEEIGRIATIEQTLALEDNGHWYLLRVSEIQQLAILREVYPSFVGVDFPAATMTALD